MKNLSEFKTKLSASEAASGHNKLILYKDLPENRKKGYQREQRLQEKEEFRDKLRKGLGPDFVNLIESIEKYGLMGFKDFIEPGAFQILQQEYDKVMKEEGASSSTFKFNFANLVKRPSFLLNSQFKDAFFHPLLVAIIAYQTGGPVRLVDARAKNAGSEETMVRDNGPHLDDNPFSDEWKLLVSWSVDENGNSLDAGPQGQTFVSFPGTEMFVRNGASEYGANFKNPKELLQVLRSKALQGKVFGIEAKSDRPLYVLFEASHQIHHRKRSKNEPGRACYIESFHIVDPTHNPPPYFSKPGDKALVGDPLDRFLLCGEGDEAAFMERLLDKEPKIREKMAEVQARRSHMPAHEKMMTPFQLVKYLKLMTSTFKREMLESREELRFSPQELAKDGEKEIIIEKLRSRVGERDKHYDLDLIVYLDQREQHRKIPRTRIRERQCDALDDLGRRGVACERFLKLTMPPLPRQEPMTPAILHKYAADYLKFGGVLRDRLLTLGKKPGLPKEFGTLLEKLFSDETFPEMEASKLLKILVNKDPKLAEIVYMCQLVIDLTESLSRQKDITELRAHAYFLYLVYDEVLRDRLLDGCDEGLEKIAQACLQRYFDLVIHDDFTYKITAHSQDIADEVLFDHIADMLTREESNLEEAKESKKPPQSLLFSNSFFFQAQKKHFPKEAEISGEAMPEETLFQAMLQESAKNKVILDSVRKFSHCMHAKVFSPLVKAVKECNSLDELPLHVMQSVTWFVDEHSSKHNQRLGLKRSKSPQEIFAGGKTSVLELLIGIEQRLTKLSDHTDLTADNIVEAVKSMNDLAFCYIEYFPARLKSSDFALSEGVQPSPEELLARVKRDEKGQDRVPYSHTADNKVMPSVSRGHVTGKSVFWGVDFHARTEIEVAKYDTLSSMVFEKLSQNQQSQLNAAKEFMQRYRIPFNRKERLPVSNYVRPSAIETISTSSALPGSASFPLMAGTSTTTGRTLRALYDMGVFDNQGGSFNFQDAQIAANLCASMLGQEQHHSFLELVEPYNRLLSIAGIRELNAGRDQQAREAQMKQYPVKRINKHMMPHFFHDICKDKVVERAHQTMQRGSTPRSRL